MSGGNIHYQRAKGQHQIVTFIFAGQLDDKDVREWNERIQALKQRFGNKVMGVTVKGERSGTLPKA